MESTPLKKQTSTPGRNIEKSEQVAAEQLNGPSEKAQMKQTDKISTALDQEKLLEQEMIGRFIELKNNPSSKESYKKLAKAYENFRDFLIQKKYKEKIAMAGSFPNKWMFVQDDVIKDFCRIALKICQLYYPESENVHDELDTILDSKRLSQNKKYASLAVKAYSKILMAYIKSEEVEFTDGSFDPRAYPHTGNSNSKLKHWSFTDKLSRYALKDWGIWIHETRRSDTVKAAKPQLNPKPKSKPRTKSKVKPIKSEPKEARLSLPKTKVEKVEKKEEQKKVVFKIPDKHIQLVEKLYSIRQDPSFNKALVDAWGSLKRVLSFFNGNMNHILNKATMPSKAINYLKFLEGEFREIKQGDLKHMLNSSPQISGPYINHIHNLLSLLTKVINPNAQITLRANRQIANI